MDNKQLFYFVAVGCAIGAFLAATIMGVSWKTLPLIFIASVCSGVIVPLAARNYINK